MSTPSLLNIPYVIKAGTLYSQIPETGAGDFVVTRATTPTANRSTRINANGFIELVNDNVPRLDYPLGGAANGCASLLVEPSGTNLALQSENFTTTWTLTTATVSGNTTVAPDGTLTADTLTATAVNGQVQQVITGVSGTTYTASFYIKRRTGTGVVNIRAVENVDTPVTVTNNWTRVSFSATATTTTVRIGIRLATSGDEVDLWGAQLETGSIATSYIPTTTQAITRGADVINKTSIASLIGQTEGTIYAEVDIRAINIEGYMIRIGLASFDNTIYLTRSSANNISAIIRQGGSNIFSGATSGLGAGRFKIALAYSNNSHALYVNGNAIASGTTALSYSVALSDIRIGSFSDTTAFFNDRIRAFALYPNRLTNAQLQTLTTP